MALERVVRRMKPENMVASDAGTSSGVVCSLASGKADANSSAKPVASAPSSMEGRKPISGSSSRLICTSRIALIIIVYSSQSWLALRFYAARVYIVALRDLYEAYAVYSFYQLMLQFLGGPRVLAASLVATGRARC